MRELCRLQDELEVAYARIVVVSVDPPEVQAAFRAGLGARFVFLSDAERRWLPRLGLEETTDTLHRPYLPAAFTLFGDLTDPRRLQRLLVPGPGHAGGAATGPPRDHARAFAPDWELAPPWREAVRANRVRR